MGKTSLLSVILVVLMLSLAACTAGPVDSGDLPAGDEQAVWVEELSWFQDFTFVDEDHGWLVAGKGSAEAYLVLKTNDGGENWMQAAEFEHSVLSLSFTSLEHGWAVTRFALWKTLDGGETWQEVSGTPDGLHLHSTGWLNADDGWITGSDADRQRQLWRTRDGGASWQQVEHPCGPSGMGGGGAGAFISPAIGWMMCGDDQGDGRESKYLYQTHHGGETWTPIAEAVYLGNYERYEPSGLWIGGYIGDLHFPDDQHGWFGTARYPWLFSTDDGGETWEHIPIPEIGTLGLLRVERQSAGTGHVMIRSAWNALLRTDDGGETWEVILSLGEPPQQNHH